ncbi:MAG: cobalt-precorrin-6A reductase [Rhodobacteraceae bacterium]|nr:cobalt-precorrin-6A reductase [Paracoccaceae bacterium]
MAPTVLILGGTAGATELAHAVAEAGIAGVFSYAGRVARPKRQPLPTRHGGFGGVDGLVDYLVAHRITHVIDATHPFAAQMSSNAIEACDRAGVPLLALTRPQWRAQEGDTWQRVADIDSAVEALAGSPLRVMLALGRLNLPAFAAMPQHAYLLRLVDPPEGPLPFPNYDMVIDRGPFTYDADLALLRAHRIDVIVSKNSGGSPARAKVDAARALGIPIIMIDRPVLPDRREVTCIDAVLDWIAHTGTERGV